MLGGKGYYRGSSILLSGTAGTGKTSVAATFVDAAARRGERALYFAFEESPNQIIRNMESIGLRLRPWVERGLLQFHAQRPTFHGLEMHLLTVHDTIRRFKPRVVVIDPVTNLVDAGTQGEARSMLMRLIDFLKSDEITGLFTSLTHGGEAEAQSELGVSSLMDTWLLLRNLENGGERNRGIYILKSRGMPHSNQVREFVLSKKGIDLVPVYMGAGGMLTGRARIAQEARDWAEALQRRQRVERRRREVEREQRMAEAQSAVLQASLDAKAEEVDREIAQEAAAEKRLAVDRQDVAWRRESRRKRT
jgi:circadian clock protein KaiC